MPRPHERENAATTRIVTLVHGRHRWLFRCAAGDEPALVAAAARAALRGGSGLDLADAAILARRLDAWPGEGAAPRGAGE